MATFLPDGIWEVPALRILSQGQAAIREAMTALMAPIEYWCRSTPRHRHRRRRCSFGPLAHP